jgi:hypothetical protein
VHRRVPGRLVRKARPLLVCPLRRPRAKSLRARTARTSSREKGMLGPHLRVQLALEVARPVGQPARSLPGRPPVRSHPPTGVRVGPRAVRRFSRSRRLRRRRSRGRHRRSRRSRGSHRRRNSRARRRIRGRRRRLSRIRYRRRPLSHTRNLTPVAKSRALYRYGIRRRLRHQSSPC